MMKIARLLCVLWVCGPLALQARAADSPARNGVVAPPAKLSRAGHPAAHESTQTGPSKGDGAKGRNAALAASPRRASAPTPRAAGPLARSNADRLRSPHPAKARGNNPLTPNRRVGTSAKAMVRGSAIGGPRAAAGPGQLGGPATGRRTVHNTAIDGTQVRHKT